MILTAWTLKFSSNHYQFERHRSISFGGEIFLSFTKYELLRPRCHMDNLFLFAKSRQAVYEILLQLAYWLNTENAFG